MLSTAPGRKCVIVSAVPSSRARRSTRACDIVIPILAVISRAIATQRTASVGSCRIITPTSAAAAGSSESTTLYTFEGSMRSAEISPSAGSAEARRPIAKPSASKAGSVITFPKLLPVMKKGKGITKSVETRLPITIPPIPGIVAPTRSVARI